MDKIKDISTNLSHSFSVSERIKIIISGVGNIASFEWEDFFRDTVLVLINLFALLQC